MSEKKIKKKGPFRTELLLPVGIFIALVSLYANLFLDSHLKAGSEWIMTYIHGAEVNVGEVETSLFEGSLVVKSLQVTDKDNPKFNLVQLHRISFDLNWDALLRAKFVMDDAALKGIGFQVKRKRPGRVIPVEKSGKGALKKVGQNVLSQASEQYKGKTLGDLSQVLAGDSAKGQLGEVKKELGAEKKIEELKKDINEREKHWKKKVGQYEKKQRIESLEKKVENFKFNKSKPLESVKEIKKLIKEGEQIVKNSKEDYKNLQSDIKKFKQSSSRIDQWIKQDVERLKNRASLPELDASSFAMGLFGKLFGNKVAGVAKYTEVAKEYMPPKRKKSEKPPKLAPKKRSEGRNYTFPITDNYPGFWLKNMEISSASQNLEWSGNFEGSAKNFSSHPAVVDAPATVTIKGDIPKQNIYGFQAKLTVDHTKPPYTQDLEASIRRYPLQDLRLSTSQDMNLLLTNTDSRLNFSAHYEWERSQEQDKALVSLEQVIPSPKFRVKAKNKKLEDFISRSLSGMQKLTVSAKAEGPFKSLSWKVSSNIGKALERGVKREFQNLVDDQEEKYREFVENKVAPRRKKIEGEIDQFQKKYSEFFGSKKKKANGLTDQLQKKQKEGGDLKKIEDDVKDSLKGLKDKLGF